MAYRGKDYKGKGDTRSLDYNSCSVEAWIVITVAPSYSLYYGFN